MNRILIILACSCTQPTIQVWKCHALATCGGSSSSEEWTLCGTEEQAKTDVQDAATVCWGEEFIFGCDGSCEADCKSTGRACTEIDGGS
jgi:hypothetical protein